MLDGSGMGSSMLSYFAGLSRIKKFQICLWVTALFVLFHVEKGVIFQPPEDHDVKLKNETELHHHEPDSTSIPSPLSRTGQPRPTQAPSMRTRPITQTPTKVPKTNPSLLTTSGPPTKGSSSLIPSNSTKSATSVTLPPAKQIQMSPSNFTVHLPKSDTESEAEKRFVQDNCDLAPLTSWYPNKEAEWEQRAPYFLLAGVWNSGVTTLATALRMHPQISPDAVKTNGFFLPKHFYRYQIGKGDKRRVKVFSARQRMYAQVYATKTLKENQKIVAMDVSPGYFFYAKQVAQSILCVSPWAKSVVLLRNPVDRVYQQWVYGRVNLGLRLSIEEWMAQEMKLMQSVGLARYSTPEAEKKAWIQYQSVRRLSGAIGRSLYVLQLQEWIDTLKAAGKDPKQSLHIIPSEQWERQPESEFGKLVQFLGLAKYTPQNLVSAFKKDEGGFPPMKDETRKVLEDFFEPYNKRLFKLLKDEFGMTDLADLWK